MISLAPPRLNVFKNIMVLRKMSNAIDGVKKAYGAYKKLQEANRISQHFSNFFEPVVASTQEELSGVQKIRHDVFCQELKLFEATGNNVEVDFFDAYSSQCLIKHTRTGTFGGSVRIINPRNDDDILPIEKVASEYITKTEYLPSNFDRHEVCEISRIAIPKEFRRRRADQFKGAAQAAINTDTYSEEELRCFPLIAVGLYISAAALAVKQGKKHAYFMVEPRLAKSMRYIGIKLIKIGGEFNYVGRRAPYYVNYELFCRDLSPSFKYMMDQFLKKMG